MSFKEQLRNEILPRAVERWSITTEEPASIRPSSRTKATCLTRTTIH